MIRNSLRNHHLYHFPWKLCYNNFLKITSKMSFPHRLKYGRNYKICILPIVQKTAGKKNIHNFFLKMFKKRFEIFLLRKKLKIKLFFRQIENAI